MFKKPHTTKDYLSMHAQDILALSCIVQYIKLIMKSGPEYTRLVFKLSLVLEN